MTKQEVLNIIEKNCSIIKSFLDEYRLEWTLRDEDILMTFFDDIKCQIEENRIPESLYDRISKLITYLGIDKLKEKLDKLNNAHNFESYRDLVDNVFFEFYFVRKTYYLFKSIGFTNSNIVLIGANGSGKTTFANSIRKELERSDSGIVIPAQKLLIFPTYTTIPAYKTANQEFEKRQTSLLNDKQTFNADKSDDFPYSLSKQYSEEMKVLLSALLSERIEKRNEYCSNAKDGDVVNTKDFRSGIDDVIEIWNSMIEHRTLFCDNASNLKIKFDDKVYDAFQMSDGEREIFYVVGRVLLAKPSSLIIIDEPELHLHKAILNKLWDTLEEKRNDCLFIYLTHDIDFASTRIAKKCWLKSYSYDLKEDWEVEPIGENDIPEALLMKLLGSRKKILFCEGKKNSYDVQIFEILFPNYTIIPVATCKDVINYTKAFNKIENKYAQAFGIIDRDFRRTEQLDKLKEENVFSYNVAEIENLFMIDDFIKGFAEYKKESCDIDDIKDKVIELFKKNIIQQTSAYVTNRINYVFNESHVKNGKTLDEVSKYFNDFVSQIQVNTWFSDRLQYLNDIVQNKDYRKAILTFNNKGLHCIIEKAFGMSSYNTKALLYLKEYEAAKNILRNVFPNEINN